MRAMVAAAMAFACGGLALAYDQACPAKDGDPCRVEQNAVCDVDKNPPPWATAEWLAKKRGRAERDLKACRDRHKDDPPPSDKKPSPLPPWRKP